ncbi:hypothetical protein BFW01_g839 [Lasiodiplodia theobromae]|uniref:Uncharacterized protein n=1 Tax=Lasiodiplodia theobromae TaxID=45133 RepID=A0A8H7MBD5_9PEZI|nr:hypothetical protein BFW01_g839 [Lasiodiplodia theobromae]
MKLPALSLFLSTAAASGPLFLMHGYSVVIFPSNSSSNPGDSKVVTANFFSYGTSTGYLSFGWWLPPSASTNHTGCVARPESYDWYEYSTGNCTATDCHVHCVNYPSDDPETKFLDDDYVVHFLDIGPGDEGKMHVSYFDKENGGYAVGKRRVLNAPGADRETAKECHDAFLTMQELQDRRNLPIDFELVNPCPRHEDSAQMVLSEL